MKVAVLSREYPPEVYGGAGSHVASLTAALRPLVDVDVHCFGRPRSDPLVAASYTPWDAVSSAGEGATALGVLSVGLAMAAGVVGADVVHSHTWYANLGGHLAKLVYGIPHVVTSHSLEPLRPWKAEQLGRGGYAVSLFAERTALEGADAVIAVSAAMGADLVRVYPSVEPARVNVIHNGVDAGIYRPRPDPPVLERLGIDPGRPFVVFLGRITRQKGIVHLLQAADHLDPAAQLVLCAAAPDTPEIEKEMRAGVARLREQRGGVIWTEEQLTQPEVVAVLSSAAAFVCPSVYEPFGLVNVEAMACGAPVVASAVGGIPEVVVDGETGFLVPVSLDPAGRPADPGGFARALADRVNQLIAEPELGERLGRAGRRRVVEHFTWEAVARHTVALYSRLVRGR